jgi:hypothetical protein
MIAERQLGGPPVAPCEVTRVVVMELLTRLAEGKLALGTSHI